MQYRTGVLLCAICCYKVMSNFQKQENFCACDRNMQYMHIAGNALCPWGPNIVIDIEIDSTTWLLIVSILWLYCKWAPWEWENNGIFAMLDDICILKKEILLLKSSTWLPWRSLHTKKTVLTWSKTVTESITLRWTTKFVFLCKSNNSDLTCSNCRM